MQSGLNNKIIHSTQQELKFYVLFAQLISTSI